MTEALTAPADKKNDQLVKAPLSPSDRFTNAVQREFATNNGEIQLTNFQKKLCQNYFIKIDMMLGEAERKRLAKPERYREPLAYSWENVNLKKLAVDVIIYSSVGLDPTQPNHISPIPFKNNNLQKYDITFIMGYKGIELKSKKYGLDLPDDIVVELVYSNDKFKQTKKDINNRIEGYTFEVVSDFDRGDIIGGFYYHKYFDSPEKNKLKVFSKKDIEKRRPDHASAEFWGGEKDNWEWDEEKQKSVKKGKIEVEGWYDEMAYKTIYRAAYNAITIDSEKIDANYLAVIQREKDERDYKVANEILTQSNGAKTDSSIGIDEEPEDTTYTEDDKGEIAQNAQQTTEPAEHVDTTSVQEPTDLFNQPKAEKKQDRKKHF